MPVREELDKIHIVKRKTKMPFSCFCSKAEKETYTVLDYSHGNYVSVPPEIYDHAISLEELYLDANQFKELPKALFTLQKLKKLNICDNEIIALPSTISNLVHLLELDVSKNGFLELPENIRGLKSLEVFDASVNPLGRLPDGFTLLLNLTHVSLNDTFLDFLPANIGRLSKLEVLEVRENHLSTLPKSMNRLTSLRRLDIGNNEFSDVPEVIGSLTRLQELWLDFNQLRNIPMEVGNLKFLEFLDASENRIEWIADEVGECDSLTDLHLTTNLLTQLPENLCKLKKLQTLKVDDNHLTHLPTSIGGLSSLRELIVNGNELESLPPGVGLLRELITLNADENFIEDLPEEVGSCSSLTWLSLRRNKLLRLPDEIGRLHKLIVFNLSSNVLENLPYSMMKLKNLKALWLSENQSKPLIPLQTEFDATKQKRFLTNYMFPQHPLSELENASAKSDDKSFHASLFEEEWRKRTSVVFDVDDLSEQEVIRLSRQPTPYPKDIRDKIQHFREVALAKQQHQHGGVAHGHHEHQLDAVALARQHHRDHAEQGANGPTGVQMPVQSFVNPAAASLTSSYESIVIHDDGAGGSQLPTNPPIGQGFESYSKEQLMQEEDRLLSQLQSQGIDSYSNPNASEADKERMQAAIKKYQEDCVRMGVQTSVSTGCTRPGELRTDISPSVERTSNHVQSRMLPPKIDPDEILLENSTSGDSYVDGLKPKSEDSGLGSVEIVNENQQWKNECPAIPEQEEVFRVLIKKNPQLGFSISGGYGAPPNPFRPDDEGIFITKVLPDGPAASSLRPGDKVLRGNGIDFTQLTHGEAVEVLKANNTVELILERSPPD